MPGTFLRRSPGPIKMSPGVPRAGTCAAYARTVNERVSIAVLTHNRVDEVLRGLTRLYATASASDVIVVDNGSRDGTAVAITKAFPQVTIVRAGANLGAAGRNLALRRARAPYVALS